MLNFVCRFILLCFTFLWINACAEKQPRKQVHQVRCKYWLQKCHLAARHRCRRGYTVMSSVRTEKVGGPQGRYREFVMRVTCN